MSKLRIIFYVTSISLILVACNDENTVSTSPNIAVWAQPTLISVNKPGYSFCPDIAVGPQGNAIAVWKESNVGNYTINFNTYDSQTGWGTPGPIDDGIIGQFVGCPNIAINAQGDAIVGWLMEDGAINRYRMWAKRYTVSNGWEPAQRVDVDYQTSSEAEGIFLDSDVAIDEYGNAVAVWVDETQTDRNTWSNVYTAKVGWANAQSISTPGSFTQHPKVSMALGKAIVAWGDSGNLKANVYTPAMGWGISVYVENSEGKVMPAPTVAISADGSGIILFEQDQYLDPNSFPPSDIYAVHYINDTWLEPILFHTDKHLYSSVAPEVAMDASGNAIVAWQDIAGLDEDVYGAYYDRAGNKWSNSTRLHAGHAWYPKVAMNNLGEGIVMWAVYGNLNNRNAYDAIVRRFSKDTGWSEPGLIARTTYYGEVISYNEIAINESGEAFMVWVQDNPNDNTYYIWSSNIQ